MKKTFTIAILLFLAVGTIWYVRSKVNYQPLPADQSLSNQAATSSVSVSDVAISSNDFKKADLLKVRALEILARPVLVKIAISESSKKSALAKIEELTKLIGENYDYANAWYDLGAYRMVIGDYEGAIDAYKFVNLIRTGDYVSYGNLGDIYGFYLKNYPLAEESFLKAIKNNSAYVLGYTELAKLYENSFSDGQNKAENLLLSGIKFNSQDLYLKIKLAEFYERSGRKSDALNLFREVLSLDPANKSVEAKVWDLSQ